MRKRLEEAAEGYAESRDYAELENEILVDDEGNTITKIYTFEQVKDAFITGGEVMFKECGGMTVLHDMRRLILAQCKEWLKNNINVCNQDEMLEYFETDILKLWEGGV